MDRQLTAMIVNSSATGSEGDIIIQPDLQIWGSDLITVMTSCFWGKIASLGCSFSL